MDQRQSGQMTPFVKAAFLSGKNTWMTRSVPRVGLPSIFLADGPHGLRKQVGSSDHLGLNESVPATCFPTAATVANSWSPSLGEKIGQALGSEAGVQDVAVILGPGLNIKRSPLCGRNFEYFSEDPLLSGRLAASYVRGIQSTGVAACPKHFAVNSQETRRMTNDSIVDADTLLSIYLTAFEIAVKEGSPWMLMSSYNLVNGHYANENRYLLRDVLRDQWGYAGAVVTDWGGGNDPVLAINNGGGLEMPSPGFDSAAEIMNRMDEVDQEQFRQRVSELAELVRKVNPQPVAGDHGRLAEYAAEESIVLLKNDDVLPLEKRTKVAVIGDFAFRPRFQGAGSSQVNPTEVVPPVEALAASDLTVVGTAPGFARGSEKGADLLAEAVKVAARAEVVLLYIGLDETAEAEGRERSTLAIDPSQVELLAALADSGATIVAVLCGGAPIEMPWLSKCAAVVHGYLGGQRGALAMVKVLEGRVNPSGHLAETYPLSLEQTPTAKWYPMNGPYSYYKEGPFVGYRYYTTAKTEVLFPFGFGLSYTSFTYSNLSVNDEGATVSVTNVGDRAGADVVQLYVQGNPAVACPSWELKGFTKVYLAPGETVDVTIPFDEYTFRSAVQGQWHVYEGERIIRISQDAMDSGVTQPLMVAGETPDFARPEAPNFIAGRAQEVTDEEFTKVLGRPLPRPEGGPLGVNSPLCDMRTAKSPLARALYRFYFLRKMEKMEKSGTPDLDLLFQYGMPFRAIAKMSGGMASMEMVESILWIVNGRTFRGLGGLVSGFFKNRSRQKRLSARFERESE